MQCPKCQSELTPRTIDTVTVDECHACEGIWFDKDELRRVKDSTDPDLNWMDFEIWKQSEAFAVAGGQTACPRCTKPMHVVNYSTTGVAIDYCHGCDGIWLDKGELERIIGALEQELLDKSLGRYVRETLGEANALLAGPESFVSEWKDFATITRLLQYRVLSLRPALASKIALLQNNPLNI